MVALSPLPWHLFPGTPMCVDREEQNQFLKTMGLLNVVHAFFATGKNCVDHDSTIITT